MLATRAGTAIRVRRIVEVVAFARDGAFVKVAAVRVRLDCSRFIHLLGDAGTTPSVPRMVADALSTRRVLRIRYGDREGAATMREIEPLGYVGTATHWYLVAWCRLRDALRAFRTDRITSVSVTAEVPTPRSLRTEDLDIPQGIVYQLTLS